MNRLRKFPILIVAAIYFGGAFTASAHPPRENLLNTFQRNDSTAVSIVEHSIDGITTSDPVCVEFRLSDGTPIACTAFTKSIVLKKTASGFPEVYQFESSLFPMANRVDRFDGHGLTEVTSPGRRLLSIGIHTAKYWPAYLISLAIAGIFVMSAFTISRIPKQGHLLMLRKAGFLSVGVAGTGYLFMIAWLAPISPLILCALGGILILCFAGLRKMVKRKFRASRSES